MSRKILIVDDEPEMVSLLERALSMDKYEVKSALDGRTGLRLAHEFQPDLVVLDVMMPDLDGWDVLRRLRDFSQVPVVMLTAMGTEESKVHGLDLGADDYITKPFGIRELKARIRAALRRSGMPFLRDDRPLVFDHGELIIDPCSYKVTVRGNPVELTPTEHKLLFYLAHNAGRVLTHQQILEEVWGPGYEDSVTNVKVYIQRLRRKIERDPGQPRYIQTQRGIGYCLVK
jgi:two-component system KDP operon response regulator KdpE